MGKLTQRTIKKFKKKKYSLIHGDDLRIAGDLFQKSISKSFDSGYKDTNQEPIDQKEINRLKNAVVKELKGQKDPMVIGGLIWALGKSGDKKYETIYRKLLKSHLKELKLHYCLVFQAIVALENSGKIGPSSPKKKIDFGVDRTIEKAEKYLKKHKIVVPW